jgi:hypothetical protein
MTNTISSQNIDLFLLEHSVQYKVVASSLSKPEKKKKGNNGN